MKLYSVDHVEQVEHVDHDVLLIILHNKIQYYKELLECQCHDQWGTQDIFKGGVLQFVPGLDVAGGGGGGSGV